MYDNLTIYYFSGTGNALTASRWIRENAERKGIRADLIPIDRFKKINVPVAEGKRLMGFCYPTHGFGLPWIMLKFIFKFSARERCDVFLLNTRAGSKIHKWFAPGVSGIAQVLPIALILKIFNSYIPLLLIKPADFIINWGISLTLFFVISGAVFWLIRIKLINKVFSATALTNYWRRYLAPGVKSRDY